MRGLVGSVVSSGMVSTAAASLPLFNAARIAAPKLRFAFRGDEDGLPIFRLCICALLIALPHRDPPLAVGLRPLGVGEEVGLRRPLAGDVAKESADAARLEDFPFRFAICALLIAPPHRDPFFFGMTFAICSSDEEDVVAESCGATGIIFVAPGTPHPPSRTVANVARSCADCAFSSASTARREALFTFERARLASALASNAASKAARSSASAASSAAEAASRCAVFASPSISFSSRALSASSSAALFAFADGEFALEAGSADSLFLMIREARAFSLGDEAFNLGERLLPRTAAVLTERF